MVQQVLSSPCWFCATCVLLLLVYGLGSALAETVRKRWSLTTIAKRLTRIERRLDERSAPRKEHKPPVRKVKNNVVYLDDYRPPADSEPPEAS